MKQTSLWLLAGLTLALVLLWGSAMPGQIAAFTSSPPPPAPASWRSGGPFDNAGHPLRVDSIVASPAYPDDGILFAAATDGVYRSNNRGQSWRKMVGRWLAEGATSYHLVRLSPNYANDGRVLAAFRHERPAPADAISGLLQSTDRGQTWNENNLHTYLKGLVFSPAFQIDHTLFAADDRALYTSTDAGANWAAQPFLSPLPLHTTDLDISPDFTHDHTLFVTGFDGALRSSNAGQTWEKLTSASPAYNLAISPAFASDGAAWQTFRAIESPGNGAPESAVLRTTDRGATWRPATTGLPGVYEPFPWPLAVSPTFASDHSLFTALRGQLVAWDQHCLFRSRNAGDAWIDLGPAPGNPDAFDLAVTRTNAEGLTAHVATAAGVWHYSETCEEWLLNGGFETDAAWIFPDTPYPAAYSTTLAHSGRYSLRAGIASGADVYSYSSARQSVTIPTGMAAATLTFWWHPLSQEEQAPSLSPAQPALDDAQYLLLLDEQGRILETLLWTRSNSRTWQQLSFDLTPYAGRTIFLQFGVFNNGDGRITAMYVDDVSLSICQTQTVVHHIYLPLLLHTPSQPELTSTPTPTPTPFPAATRTPTPTPSATLTASPTPTSIPPACYEGVRNGGFETNAVWLIKDNPVLAAYVATPTHSGAGAIRTGIALGGANLRSYSPVEQTITIPAGLVSAQLRLWRHRLYGDPASALALPTFDTLPKTETELPTIALENDFFYVIAIQPDGAIRWLLVERVNDPAWRQTTIDLSNLGGQTVRLQIGTYNNGAGGRSTTYIDDVSLTLCPPPGALLLPPGWAQRLIGRPDSSTLYADAGGALYRSDDAGSSWSLSGTIPPVYALRGHNPSTLFAGAGYPCYKGGPPTPFWRSTDGGAHWQELPAGQNLKPLAAHSSQPWVYAAGCDAPYRSTDAGATWRRQPDPLFGSYDTYFLAPADPAWATIWVGGISEGGGGTVLVSRDAGVHWAQATPLDPELGWLGGLRVGRFQPGRIYVAAVYGFRFSANDGALWQENSAGLDDVIDVHHVSDRPYGIFDIAETPAGASPRLYLATVRGLYSRDPVSLIWAKVPGTAYADRRVEELLALAAAPNKLYVTTEHGVFVHNLAAP